MVNGLISVIVPVYNVEKYLHKCIESIIRQTYTNLEILLIDDGSTDSSGIICDCYAEKDMRIKVFHKENGGQASARNFALEIAKGEFIGFVDSDDWIEPEMYQRLYEAIVANNVDISMCGRANISETGKVLNNVFTFKDGFSMSSSEAIKRFLLLDGIDSASWDKLFKREIAVKHRYPLGLICEDIPYVYNCIKSAKRIYHVGESFYNYLQRNNSTSRSRFLSRSKGLFVYPKEICEDISNNFPNLKLEADYYMFYEHCAYYRLLYKSNKSIKENSAPISLLYLKRVLFNPYLDKHSKIAFVLFKFRVYRILQKIRRS